MIGKCDKCGAAVESADQHCGTCGAELPAAARFHLEVDAHRPHIQHHGSLIRFRLTNSGGPCQVRLGIDLHGAGRFIELDGRDRVQSCQFDRPGEQFILSFPFRGLTPGEYPLTRLQLVLSPKDSPGRERVYELPDRSLFVRISDPKIQAKPGITINVKEMYGSDIHLGQADGDGSADLQLGEMYGSTVRADRAGGDGAGGDGAGGDGADQADEWRRVLLRFVGQRQAGEPAAAPEPAAGAAGAAGGAKVVCGICGADQDKEQTFWCRRCHRTVCQTHKDIHRLLCEQCAAVLESQSGPAGGPGDEPAGGAPGAATLTVTSDPPGAEVVVDTQSAGVTPLWQRRDLAGQAAREVEVVVRKSGYRSRAAVVRLVAGASCRWDAGALEPSARPGGSASAEAAPAEVEQVAVEPLSVHVEAAAAPDVEMPGVPGAAGVPGLAPEILAREGQLRGLEQAVAALAGGTHPSLAAAQAGIRRLREQWLRLQSDVEMRGRDIPGYLRSRLEAELPRRADGRLSPLVNLASGVPAELVIGFLHALQSAHKARAALDQAAGAFEQARAAKVAELRLHADGVRGQLLELQQEDFRLIVHEFLARTAAAAAGGGAFPLEAWMQLAPVLAARRYLWDPRRSLALAEEQFRAWPDQCAWHEACSRGQPQAYDAYLSAWPAGRYAQAARAALDRLASAGRRQQDDAWQDARRADTVEAYEAYLSAWPAGEHADDARSGRAFAAEAQAWQALAYDPAVQAVGRYAQAVAGATAQPGAAEAVGRQVRARVSPLSALAADRAEAALAAGRPGDAAECLAAAMALAGDRPQAKLLDLWDRLAGNRPATGIRRLIAVGSRGGHAGAVKDVAATADGRTVVSAGADHTIRVWDLDSGCCVRSLCGHGSGVTRVRLLAGGTRVASAGLDRTCRLWDLASGQCLQVLGDYRDHVTALAVMGDDRLLVSGSRDRKVYLHDLHDGRCLRTFQGHTEGVTAVSVSPDGRQIVSASQDSTLRLWDVQTGKSLKVFRSRGEFLNDVAFGPDGSWVAFAADDRTAGTWHLAGDGRTATLAGHASRVLAVCVAADGRRAVSAGRDRTVRMWDLQAGTCLWTSPPQGDEVSAVCLAGGDRAVIVGACDGLLGVLDAETGQPRPSPAGEAGPVTACGVSGDGTVVVSVNEAGAVRAADLCGSAATRDFRLDAGVRCLALSSNARYMLAGGGRGRVEIWDVHDRRRVRALAAGGGGIQAVQFSADLREALAADDRGVLTAWDLSTGQCRANLGGGASTPAAAALGAEGRWALTGAARGVLTVWDLRAARQCAQVCLGEKDLTALAVAPGGKLALAGSQDGTVWLLALPDAKVLAVLDGHAAGVSAVQFAPAAGWAASGDRDGALCLWDLSAGRCWRRLELNCGPVIALSVGPAGRRLVSLTGDGVMRAWRIVWDHDLASPQGKDG